jgi:hypothetical protein
LIRECPGLSQKAKAVRTDLTTAVKKKGEMEWWEAAK